eukprot:TRINITY_DN16312_c4_g1_i1.p1 TRINITY_DN16312_c4_g1~~TRINITY_DN16312_c4_g1_i1.p1  ORF type:complete len:405 (-),score=81.00 TRINITY_DN16312_c4_g1_i1:128-1342(-)
MAVAARCGEEVVGKRIVGDSGGVAAATMAVATASLSESHVTSTVDAAAEEDAFVRAALRGGSELPLKVHAVQQTLQRALDALCVEHRSLTGAWRGPLTLFTPASAERARQPRPEHAGRRVPEWAISTVLQSRILCEEAAGLWDCAEAYQAQVSLAVRTKSGMVARKPLIEALDRLDNLAKRIRVHGPALQEARAAFDAPPDSGSAVPEAVLRAEAESIGKVDSADAIVSRERVAQNLVEEPKIILKPQLPASFRLQKLWASASALGKVSSAYVKKAVEIAATDARGALGSATRVAADTADTLGQQLRGAGGNTEAADDGCGNGFKLESASDAHVALAIPWHKPWRPPSAADGHPSAWLGLDDRPLLDRRRLATVELFCESIEDETMKRLWERCRRRDARRWSLP